MKKITKIQLVAIINDIVFIYISIILAVILRQVIPLVLPFIYFPPWDHTLEEFLSMYWIPAILIFFLYSLRTYTVYIPYLSQVKSIFSALAYSFITIFSVVSLGRLDDQISRFVLTMLFIVLSIVIPLSRYMLYTIISISRIIVLEVISLEINTDLLARTIPIACNIHYAKHCNINNLNKYDLVFLSAQNKPLIKDLIANTNNIKQIVVVNSSPTPEAFSYISYHSIYPHVVYNKLNINLNDPLKYAIKQVFDYVTVILLTPIWLPLLIIISIAIFFTDGPPIFYKQQRIGKNLQKFYIYKFRTMKQNTKEIEKKLISSNPKLKKMWQKHRKLVLKDDPRLIKIGKFLRKTSLDELPQVINVLKGGMSLIGPRPVSSQEIEEYYKENASFCFSVKPGITGLWQASGRNKISYEHRINLDKWYIYNWSLWIDFVILAKTIKYILSQSGAA